MTVLLACNCSSTNSAQMLFGRQFWKVLLVPECSFRQRCLRFIIHGRGKLAQHTAERDSTSVEVRAQDLGLQLNEAHSVGTSVWSFGGSTLLIGVSPGLMTVSRLRSGRTLAYSPQPMVVEEEDLLNKWPSHQRDIIPWR